MKFFNYQILVLIHEIRAKNEENEAIFIQEQEGVEVGNIGKIPRNLSFFLLCLSSSSSFLISLSLSLFFPRLEFHSLYFSIHEGHVEGSINSDMVMMSKYVAP